MLLYVLGEAHVVGVVADSGCLMLRVQGLGLQVEYSQYMYSTPLTVSVTGIEVRIIIFRSNHIIF